MGYRLIIMKDEKVLKELLIEASETSIGRRPHNDLVLKEPTVSGKHAVLHLQGDELELEDLNSTNGTYVNGDAVTRQRLQLGDRIIIAPYRMSVQLLVKDVLGVNADAKAAPRQVEADSLLSVDKQEVPSFSAADGLNPAATVAYLDVLDKVPSGALQKRRLLLNKVVTTIGTPEVAMVSVTHRRNAYVLSKIDDRDGCIKLNGSILSDASVQLQSGDKIELANSSLAFFQPSL